MTHQTHSAEADEFVTLIGASMEEIYAAYRAQGLERDFSIVHRVGRHRFTKVNGDAPEAMFDGQPMIAATFWRRSAS